MRLLIIDQIAANELAIHSYYELKKWLDIFATKEANGNYNIVKNRYTSHVGEVDARTFKYILKEVENIADPRLFS